MKNIREIGCFEIIRIVDRHILLLRRVNGVTVNTLAALVRLPEASDFKWGATCNPNIQAKMKLTSCAFLLHQDPKPLRVQACLHLFATNVEPAEASYLPGTPGRSFTLERRERSFSLAGSDSSVDTGYRKRKNQEHRVGGSLGCHGVPHDGLGDRVKRPGRPLLFWLGRLTIWARWSGRPRGT